MKTLWQYGINQWIAQNEYIYDKNKEEQVEKKTWEINNKQIQAMHRTDKLRIQGMDRHLFTLPLKKQLGQSLDWKQKWVECATIVFETWVTLRDSHAFTY